LTERGARGYTLVVRMRRPFVPLLLIALSLAPAVADAMCRCHRSRVPKCANRDEKHRVRMKIDLTVVDGTVEVLTQSGPYHMPVADLDGKQVLFIFMPKGETFQGFLEEAIPASITLGVMQGATADITTAAAFVPGEYEMLLFVDSAPGGGLGPNRGDLAAFDNTVCDPTGVSIRVPVGCEDATVTLVNKHFIIF
jgi:hypothetical protein